MNVQIIIAFIAYFAILLSIGWLSYRKQKSSADFIMGSRSLNFWLTALSAHASDMSAWLFMAFPAAIFIGGLSQSWIALGLLAGMYLNWQFVARKLRTSTEEYESYTLSTFFEKRFSDTSGVIRILAATMAVVYLTFYLSGGLIAMGRLFESVFGIDYYLGLSIATFVVVIYTFTGGFVTVAWTDLFQATFLLFMILLVPAVAFFSLPDGTASILASAERHSIDLQLLPDVSQESILTIIFLVFGWGLGYFGMPHIITKFMGIKNPNDMNKSKYLGMSWELIAFTGAAAVGLIGIGFFKDGLHNPELVFVEMVKSLFNPFIAGFILCAVLAASMSTMDSQILVCASVLSEDFYKRIFHKKASSEKLLMASRLSVILVSCVSLLIAFSQNTTVRDAVQYAWSGLGSAFGPLVLMALYSKKANRYGAIAGIIVGGVVAGSWHFLNHWITDFPVPAMIPGFFLSLFSIWAVSALTQKRSAPNLQMSL